MKAIILLFGIFSFYSITAQQTKSQAPKQQQISDSICISKLKLFINKRVDSQNILIQKPEIPNIITHITSCGFKYKYTPGYKDRAFSLIVPQYLIKHSYGFGDHEFFINFDDSDSLERSITVDYDFADHFKNFFFKQIETGKQIVSIKKLNNKTIYLYKNWQVKFCGKIFLDNHLFIFYCTKQIKYENELQNAISKFNW